MDTPNSFFKDGKVTSVIGGQAGSESKGKIAGWLARKFDVDYSVSNFMPNAGHTWISDAGEKVVVQSLPQALVNFNTKLFLSPGSALDLKLFWKEIETYLVNLNRISIHPNTLIITDEHKQREAQHLNRVSSTLKGCGEALADKSRRAASVILARDVPELQRFIDGDMSLELISALESTRRTVMLEVAQGFDLDINHGVQFPYCTSRQTTPMQAIADAGIPSSFQGEIIACIRPYPIRVGNAFDKETGAQIGTSGDYSSAEISWEEVARRSGMPREEITELATVSGKLRRVFEPDFDRLRRMVKQTGTTQFALNFANYIDYNMTGATRRSEVTIPVAAFIARIEEETGVPVSLLGTGPRDGEIIDLTEVK